MLMMITIFYLWQSYRMQIGNEIGNVCSGILDVRPSFNGAQIVAQMQNARWLNAGHDFGWPYFCGLLYL